LRRFADELRLGLEIPAAGAHHQMQAHLKTLEQTQFLIQSLGNQGGIISAVTHDDSLI
jgi:hypothetical protein